jgi:hypothetical protein
MIEPRRLSGQRAAKLSKSRFKPFQKKQKNHDIPQMGDVFYAILWVKCILRETKAWITSLILDRREKGELPHGSI